MKTSSAKNRTLSWVIGLVAAATLLGAVYFVFQTNTKTSAPTITPEASPTQQVETQESTPQAPATGTVIKTGTSEYGPMLFDSRGQAIYIWELEESSTAECYGSCAKAWPPVLTDGTPVASGDVDAKLLGTTKRTDGTTQVTYNGHPLYFYANEKPGEVECHNIKTHGGLWWVIQPNGTRAP